MNARRLRWWSAASLTQARVLAEAAWQRWCTDWDVAPGPVSAANACEIACDGDAALRWRALGPGLRLAFGESNPATSLHALLFDEPAAAPGGDDSISLSAQVTAAAWNGLEATLTSVFVSPSDEPPMAIGAGAADRPGPEEYRNWSGAIRIRIDVIRPAGLAIEVSIGASLAEALLGSRLAAQTPPGRQGIVSLLAALESTPLRLPVELRELSIDLGTLQSLAEGDVIALSHRLDEPLQMRLRPSDGQGAILCEAALGARNGLRAIELLCADAGA